MSEIDFRADEDLVEALERPIRIELHDPVTGQPIVDINGKPAFVTAYSARSKMFRKRLFALQARVQSERKRIRDDIPQELAERWEAEGFACAFGDEWHICKKQKDGSWKALEVECNRTNAAKWALANPLYWDQISEKCDKIKSFIEGEGSNFTQSA